MATIAVYNAAQLTTALNSAKAGDTISLAAGNYGDVGISKQFSSDVTITAQTPGSVTFTSLNVSGSSHIAIDGVSVNFTPTASTYTWTPAVGIYESNNISFTHSTVTGGPAVSGVAQTATTTDFSGNVIGLATGYGVSVSGSSTVKVDNVEVSNFYKGVVLNKSDYVTVSHSDIHDTRTTPIVAAGGSHITIDSNHLHDVKPWAWDTSYGDHGDFLAMWTATGQTAASTDIKITNNLMEQGNGKAVLGMWMQGDAAGYTNVQISGNAILNGNYQGIMLWDVTGGAIDHNTLLQTSGADWKSQPGVILGNGAEQISVHDNSTGSIEDKSGSTGSLANSVGANALVTKWDPSSKGYYTNDLIGKTELAYDTVVDGASITAKLAAFVNTTIGTGLASTTTTTSVGASSLTTDQTLNGDWDARTLTGGSGNDVLNSKNGADTLSGGSGNDTYNIVAGRTQVVETAGGGTDTVIVKGDYTLAANVENLTINQTATDGWSGTGNELNNVILGNAGNNFLDGAAGADTINGGAGNDGISGGAGNDLLTGGAGTDTFKFAAGSGQDVITDLSKGDKDLIDIYAFTKAGYKATLTDVGADVKISFATGDSITVTGYHAKDLVVNTAGTGYVVSDSYVAPVVSAPVVTAPVVTAPVVTAPVVVAPPPPPPVVTAPVVTAPVVPGVTLNGDWDSRTLTGGAGNDIFNSKNGSDTLSGGAGDDTYNIVAGRTQVLEAAGGGTDTVIVKGDYTLAANVENLTINQTVTDGWSATGNGLNNVITGNGGNNFLDGADGSDTLFGGAGNDQLTGGAGADRLTGGAGKDIFKFVQGSGQDVITDFSKVDHDVIDTYAFIKAGYKATLTDVGADVKISFATGDAIVLTGVHASDLTATSTGFTI